MEYEKRILLLINTLLDNKHYYSTPDSFLNKSIDSFNNLIKSPVSTESIQEFLSSKESLFILEEREIKNINLFLNAEKSERLFNSLANSMGLSNDSLLKDFKAISVTPNTLCHNHFDSISIDKRFLDNSIGTKPLESLLLKLKNEGLHVPNINLVFQYDSSPTDLINQTGYFKKLKSASRLFVNSNTFDSSTFYHDYFHAMDYELSRLLKIDEKAQPPFSDLDDYQGSELKKYREFIKTYEQNNSTPEQTKYNLSLYFKTHFRSYFSNLKLEEITDSQIATEVENMNLKGVCRTSERDKAVSELRQHIQYALGSGIKPEKTIYSTFSNIGDLDNEKDYHSKNSEKLARIYQSQFHDPSIGKRWASKVLPEGTEYNSLIPALNQIIKEEFKPILQRHNALNNILKIRNNSFEQSEAHNSLTV